VSVVKGPWGKSPPPAETSPAPGRGLTPSEILGAFLGPGDPPRRSLEEVVLQGEATALENLLIEEFGLDPAKLGHSAIVLAGRILLEQRQLLRVRGERLHIVTAERDLYQAMVYPRNDPPDPQDPPP
jgi:hypothetical protein